MTKKLLVLLFVGLFYVGMASASTLAEFSCSTVSTGVEAGSTGVSGSTTCPGFTVPSGQTLTGVDVVYGAAYTTAGASGATITWAYGNNGGLTGNGLVETISGGQPVSNTYLFGGTTTGCSSPDTFNPPNEGSSGSDCVNSVIPNTVGPGSYGSFVITASAAFDQGSLNMGASTATFAVVYEYQSTVTTPEPASLMLIGGGLIGVVVLARRRRKA